MRGRLEVRGRETIGPPKKPRRDRGEAEGVGAVGATRWGGRWETWCGRFLISILWGADPGECPRAM